jgi:hypothetical protein
MLWPCPTTQRPENICDGEHGSVFTRQGSTKKKMVSRHQRDFENTSDKIKVLARGRDAFRLAVMRATS